MDIITIANADWTIDAMRAAWADDDDTAPVAQDCADAEYAWLVNNTATRLPGWRFTGDAFTGPINKDAITLICALLVDAGDYVLSVLPEIKADAKIG